MGKLIPYHHHRVDSHRFSAELCKNWLLLPNETSGAYGQTDDVVPKRWQVFTWTRMINQLLDAIARTYRALWYLTIKHSLLVLLNGPFTRYVKWRHVRHARAVMHVGVANPRWWGKRSQHSRRMRNPQIYVSDKRPIARETVPLDPLAIGSDTVILIDWSHSTNVDHDGLIWSGKYETIPIIELWYE